MSAEVTPSGLQRTRPSMDFRKVERVLIYRLGSLGDTVVALPALHLIERTFPNAQRLLLTNIPVHTKAPAAFGVISGSGLVHGFINYPLSTRKVGELALVWWQIIRFGPQIVVYLMPTRGSRSLERDRWFFRLCGARLVIGLPISEDLDHSRFDPATRLWEKEAGRLVRCLSELGEVDIDDMSMWNLRLTAGEEERGQDVLRPLAGAPLIGCGPGTKMQAKDWGRDNWRVLLARLGAELPDHGLVLVGAKEDAETGDYSAAAWPGPVLNLCGQLTPRETAAVLHRARLFLGPDSGPMHLAAAQGVPCAIAFASVDLPGRWFPAGKGHRPIYHATECANCKLAVCIENKKKCIVSITVEEMFQAAIEAMKGAIPGADARSARKA